MRGDDEKWGAKGCGFQKCHPKGKNNFRFNMVQASSIVLSKSLDIYIYKQTLVSNTFQGVCVFVDMSGTQKA